MASGYTQGEVERLRRVLAQAHQEISDERERSAQLVRQVGELSEKLNAARAEIARLRGSRREIVLGVPVEGEGTGEA